MKDRSDAGFSYIDVMIAIVILLVGVLALMAAITSAVIHAKAQEQQLDAKQIATSTMESIMSAKETNRPPPAVLLLGWIAIGNVGSNPDAGGINQGIFLNGVQPVTINAGPDQIIGTADDNGAVIPGFTRQIVITDQCDPDRPSPLPLCAIPGPFPVRMRSVVVTLTYSVGSIQRQEVATTVLTDYAVVN